jgi:hypothetical protein
VQIGGGVRRIGESAFFGCRALTSAVFERGLEAVGDSAFAGCENLTQVTLPWGTGSVGRMAFFGCTHLSFVKMPTTTRVADFAFDGCTSLASIIIPKGVTYIGNYCFSDCSNLRHIVSFPLITPSLGGNYRYNFLGVAPYGVLAVPVEAKTNSNYSYWVASNLNLGAYGWTLVYMD